MARSQGFPSSRTISPSVVTVETDKSFYGSDSGSSIPALVGFAAKGPINAPTKVTNVEDLRKKFGAPDPTVASYLLYAAEQLIQDTDYVWMVRVADTEVGSVSEAQTASVNIPSAGRAAYIQTAVAEGTPIDVVAGENDRMRFRLNGTLEEIEITIPEGSYASIIGEDGLRGVINTQLGNGAALIAEDYEDTGSGEWYLRIRVTNVYGSNSQVELVSVENSIYSTIQVGTAMTAASITGTKDRDPDSNSLAEFNLGSISSPMLQVVVFGTNNAAIDGIAQSVHFPAVDNQSAADIVDIINGVTEYDTGLFNNPMGFFARVATVDLEDRVELVTGDYNSGTPHEMVGQNAKLVVRSTSTVDTTLGFSNIGVTGTSPAGTIDGDASTFAIVTGSATGGSTGGSFEVYADSPGTVGNDTEVIISTDSITGGIQIRVYNNGSYVETFAGMNKDEYADDTTYYIENVVNTTSDYIKIIDNTSTEEGPAAGTYRLSGGTNGIPATTSAQTALLVGTEASESGLYTLSNTEAIDIDMLAVPGVSTTEVIEAMIDFCANQRQDCVAIIDPPFGMTADDVIKWHNGQHYLNLTKFDSSFAACYWPWIEVRDKYNAQNVWVPPSGNVMGAYALTERDYGVWYAPAGAERGSLNRVTDVETIPFLDERHRLYGNDNCINPIIRRAAGDVMIWGQKSMQRAQSALDRIGVRRLLLYIKKTIAEDSQDLLFKPHTEKLRNEFISLTKKTLEDIRLREGLYDYEVQCDEALNPAEVIDRNELRAKIGVQPTKAAEYLFIEIVVQNTQGEADTVGA